jgi:hypothetical protein
MADPRRNGGAQPFFNDAVAGTVVQVSPGQSTKLFSLHLRNTTAATAYLQIFFALAANVTIGTTAPDFVISLPTNAASDFVKDLEWANGVGKLGSSGLSIAGTTTPTGSTETTISVSASYA